MNKIEVRLNERDAAHYFSNSAALYVLGLGFAYFAHKASSPFMGGICFWFSVFLLCDCLRQWRVSRRLEKSGNLYFQADEAGITHFASWLWPERLRWEEIREAQVVKGFQQELMMFQPKKPSRNVFRFVFFGFPKYDLPLGAVKEGKDTFLRSLAEIPGARPLVPAVPAAAEERELPKAA